MLLCNIFFFSKSGFDYTLNILTITISKCPWFDQLDNRSYSFIQPAPISKSNVKIGVEVGGGGGGGGGGVAKIG